MSDHLLLVHPPLSVSCRRSFIMETVSTWQRTSWSQFIFAGGVCRDVWRTSFIRWSISTERPNFLFYTVLVDFHLQLIWVREMFPSHIHIDTTDGKQIRTMYYLHKSLKRGISIPELLSSYIRNQCYRAACDCHAHPISKAGSVIINKSPSPVFKCGI